MDVAKYLRRQILTARLKIGIESCGTSLPIATLVFMSLYLSKRAYERTFSAPFPKERPLNVRGAIEVGGDVRLPAIGSLGAKYAKPKTGERPLSSRQLIEDAIQTYSVKVVPIQSARQGDLIKYSSPNSIIGGLPILAINRQIFKYTSESTRIRELFRRYKNPNQVNNYWIIGGKATNVSCLGSKDWLRRTKPQPYELPVMLMGSLDNYAHYGTYCGEAIGNGRPDSWGRRYPHSFPSSPERASDVLRDLFESVTEEDVAAESEHVEYSVVQQADAIMKRTLGRPETVDTRSGPVGVNVAPITTWGIVSSRDQFGVVVRPLLIIEGT